MAVHSRAGLARREAPAIELKKHRGALYVCTGALTRLESAQSFNEFRLTCATAGLAIAVARDVLVRCACAANRGKKTTATFGGTFMKAVILAGGLGSRLSEETVLRPKPMVEIGGRPMLWHIMNICAAYGIDEFVIALGYKAEVIKEYFLNFYAINNDLSIDLSTGKTVIHDGNQPSWRVHLIDTGLHTDTGGRLKRLQPWLKREEMFLFTYGDGVSDVNIEKLVRFHKSHGKLATVTSVRSPERFGRLSLDGHTVVNFYEKPQLTEGWINGGFFILHPDAIDYIDGDDTAWERSAVERLARAGQLMAYQHEGFWSCMDTLRERNALEALWSTGEAPWKIWGDAAPSAKIARAR
jgi:glucose-1-phosphate cytidylyltransferase